MLSIIIPSWICGVRMVKMGKSKWIVIVIVGLGILLGSLILVRYTPSGEVVAPSDEPSNVKVLEVVILDTDEYQGFMPSEFTAKVGDTIELKVVNEDYNSRTSGSLANSHPITLVGPDVSMGIIGLNPGQTKSIIFTVKEGTYKFYCSQGECDIHLQLAGIIEVTE